MRVSIERITSCHLAGIDEAGSYLRLMVSCITQFNAQGPSRRFNESEEEEEEKIDSGSVGSTDVSFITSTGASASMGGAPREEKMLKGHLPRVIYHQAY